MTSTQDAWGEVAERLEALTLKLKLHLEQSQDEDVPDVLGRLRQGVEDVFEAAGSAVKDEAVRGDVRELGRLLADAVGTTLAKAGDEVREALRRNW
jgi:hypothetical protein